MKVFPIIYRASDTYGWADCPKLSKMIWGRIRAEQHPKMTWYGTDMKIEDSTTVVLYVYDILDGVCGGIGERIHEQVITEFTDGEREVLDALILARKTELAEAEWVCREHARQKAEQLQIRKELFGV